MTHAEPTSPPNATVIATVSSGEAKPASTTSHHTIEIRDKELDDAWKADHRDRAINTKASQVRQVLRERTRQIIANYIRQLPHRLELMLDSAMAHTIGLNKSGDTYRVDITNGRKSVILDLVEKHAERHLERLFDQKLEQTAQELAANPEFWKAIVSNMRDRVAYHARTLSEDRLRAAAERTITEQTQNTVDELVAPIIENAKLDLADPESFTGPLHELLLEEIARETTEAMNK